ncbi:MAG TPA: sugar kinase [Caldilineae bacterium]|jgi:2-dehydro-3-deoxygluconokinase|nr:sugar kinase [Caldilineae bacterium]
MPELITLGETMILFSPEADGPLRYVDRFQRRAAGAESNVAIAVTRLGHSAGWISRLGDDEFGRYILMSLRGEGVDVSQVRMDPDHPTGVMFRERGLMGRVEVIYYRRGSAASHLGPDDLDVAYFRSARLLHLTGITPALSASCREAVYRAIELARGAGLTISFDPNLRLKLWSLEEARVVLRDLTARADMVLVGLEEGEAIFDCQGEEAVASAILAKGPRAAVVKLGTRGAYLRTAEAELRVPAYQVPRVVDPVGAGDGFDAGVLAGWLKGWPWEDCLRLGALVGALAVTVPGDVEGYPDMAQVRAYWDQQGFEAGQVAR